MVLAHVVLEDEDERHLQPSKMSSTSCGSIKNEEEDSEIRAGGHNHSVDECAIQHAPQHLHIDRSMPVPYDEQEDEEKEQHHSPLESQKLADEQVSSTIDVEDNFYEEEDEDVFAGLDDDDDNDAFEGRDEAPAKSDRDDDGEDQIIGIVIQYDITSDMLREKGIPENASRTKLRSLQRTESYDVCLLDSHMEQHLSSSSDASFDSGNLDQFGDFGALDNWKAQDERKLEEEEPDGEEIEIVFYEEGQEPEDEEEEQELAFNLESSLHIEDHHDDIEIIFFNCHEDEDTDAGSTKFDSCHSQFASPDVKIERRRSLDTPPYDWYLPEHTDDVTHIKHTPNYLVFKQDRVNFRSTPNTVQMGSLSYEESDHGDHHSLVSTNGSTVSEVIQDLVALCRNERLFGV